jgi:hypothetical protein
MKPFKFYSVNTKKTGKGNDHSVSPFSTPQLFESIIKKNIRTGDQRYILVSPRTGNNVYNTVFIDGLSEDEYAKLRVGNERFWLFEVSEIGIDDMIKEYKDQEETYKNDIKAVENLIAVYHDPKTEEELKPAIRNEIDQINEEIKNKQKYYYAKLDDFGEGIVFEEFNRTDDSIKMFSIFDRKEKSLFTYYFNENKVEVDAIGKPVSTVEPLSVGGKLSKKTRKNKKLKKRKLKRNITKIKLQRKTILGKNHAYK